MRLLLVGCAIALLTACGETPTEPTLLVDPNAGTPTEDATAYFAVTPISASISLGGYDFDDNAFPDLAAYVSGGPPSLSFTSTGDINADLLIAADADATTYIFGTPVVFDLTFVDNRLVNGPGPDLVVFELGADDGALVDIEVGGSLVGALPYLLTATGEFSSNFSLNAAVIDLDDFGVAAGTMIETIRIDNDSAAVPGGQTISSAICAVGALNSTAPVLAIEIDVKPGAFPNRINPRSRGLIPVAILGSAWFDVSDVDPSTLLFGPYSATPAHDLSKSGVFQDHMQDVDGDGFMDLVTHFWLQESGLGEADSEACLTGVTLSGMRFEGCDSVRVFSGRPNVQIMR